VGLVLEIDCRCRRRQSEIQIRCAIGIEAVALMGHPGSGKSTVLQLIAGTVMPDSGRIAVADTVWFDARLGIARPPHARRASYVPQLTDTLDAAAPVRECLAASVAQQALPSERLSGAVRDALDAFDLTNIQNEPVAHLLAGDRRRLALACAVASRPGVLLFDEPLFGLDRRRASLVPYLRRVVPDLDAPLVFVSHNEHEIRGLATRVIHLDQGRVVFDGAPADVVWPTSTPARPCR
jgi:molybdate transport system ATP-binding protein